MSWGDNEMSVKLDVRVYDTHLKLIDEVVGEGVCGNSREDVLRHVILEHAKELLSGGSPHDPAPWTTVEAKRPRYGKAKFEQILQPGEILFEEGEVGNVAFVVESGTIEIGRLSGERPVILAELERGSIFGEMALIDDQPRSATARASRETLVRKIGKKEFLQHLRSSPEAAFEMMQQLVAIIRNLNDKVCLDSWQGGKTPDQADADLEKR